MISRVSQVNFAYINSLGISSVFNIGDSQNIHTKAKVFAVQREAEIYYSNEGDLSQYPIFEEEIPQPLLYEPLQTAFYHEKPRIKVNAVNILGVSTASVFHIGSTRDIVCETRTKHIRQLLNSRKKTKN
ncbi:spore germination protein GerPE [Metabacillus herbersteinensis]|uniref:Spore germination protein GerPE n=1 Tax=Metabacillus herbersteinensis TaxID=283816 RepID=A0ABV6GMU3_9BACI